LTDASPYEPWRIAERHVIAEIRNPEDRLIQMEESVWNHVVEQHVEMSEYLEETMSAIQTPDRREPDARAGRERYFVRGGPERWIRRD
jgi:hypothetical protein